MNDLNLVKVIFILSRHIYYFTYTTTAASHILSNRNDDFLEEQDDKSIRIIYVSKSSAIEMLDEMYSPRSNLVTIITIHICKKYDNFL